MISLLFSLLESGARRFNVPFQAERPQTMVPGDWYMGGEEDFTDDELGPGLGDWYMGGEEDFTDDELGPVPTEPQLRPCMGR